jgi:hypothetical protein
MAIRTGAIKRFSHNAGNRGLTNTSGTCKQPSVMQSSLIQGMGQGFDHMILPKQFREGFRAPFTS